MFTTGDKDSRNIISIIQAERVAGGGLPFSIDEKMYVHTIVLGMKAIEVWNLCPAIYLMVGGTVASHKWNAKDMRDLDAAFRLSFFGSGVHNSLGFAGNAINAYADTFLVPNTHLGINTSGLMYYNNNANASNVGAVMGTNDEAPVFTQLALGFDPANIGTNNTATAVPQNIVNRKGFRFMNREIAGSFYHYVNTNKTIVNNSTTVNSANKIIINAVSADSGVGNHANGTCSFAGISNGVSEEKVIRTIHLITSAQAILNRQ